MKKLWSNKWVRFGVVSALYILFCVVWTGNLWMLLGMPVIYDIYISKWFSRTVWHPFKQWIRSNKTYGKPVQWIVDIIYCVAVVTVLRYFVFAMFVIPTPSMEKSLLVGDYLFVNKLAYGPAVPNTPIAFPLVHNTMPLSKTRKSYIEWPRWKYHRLKGFGNVEMGDAVVFNFPAGDTVLLEMTNITYYDVVREYQKEYGDEAYIRLNQDFTVISRPVDKRDNYVKRCVGVPGDTVEIVQSQLIVNGAVFDAGQGQQFNYFVYTNGEQISAQRFDEMGISYDDLKGAYNADNKYYILPLTRENVERIEALGNVTSVVQAINNNPANVFPNDAQYNWTPDDFGPLWVPKKGATVQLTVENLPLYRDIIDKYEGHTLEERDGKIIINGSEATSYTFAMDYYFMMGDNRHNSADSRFWGFVPEDHIVGKASLIWFSVNRDKGLPSGIRWKRIMRKVR